MLEDWDRERDVIRSSRYADFGPDQKLKFLAALANYLLVETHSVTFKRFAMERAYVVLCKQFQLPEGQAELVVQEIVSHTGLIVPGRFDTYEFSHLSLQEFLCAYHLLRDPYNPNWGKYLAYYPAPLAIATAMSANPSMFLAALILVPRTSEIGEIGHGPWRVYLEL